MKIQYLAIIFLIIIIPMTLTLTMYNHLQIGNLNSQLGYGIYLSDATHNAVKAFELNTVNNIYSQNADSLKRDVEASVNVFLSSMAKSLGTSGATVESVSEYVPAILFTLYDGYYIYAPAYSEELTEITEPGTDIDGNPIEIIRAVSQEPKVEEFTHILKPYVYYTMRYNPNNSTTTDFVVNYTLDNYIAIYGIVDGHYVSKSGYLLAVNSENTNLLDVNVELTSEGQNKLLAILKKQILKYCIPQDRLNAAKTLDQINELYAAQDQSEINSSVNFGADRANRMKLISLMGETLLDNVLSGKYDSGSKVLLSDIPMEKFDEKYNESEKIIVSPGNEIDEFLDCFTVKYKNVEITDSDAKAYYLKGLKFSTWVNNTLSTIKIQDARDSKGNIPEEFEGRNEAIFNTKVSQQNNNPEKIESVFTQHKNEIIKQSIQSNLTASIERYNQVFFGLQHGYDMKMPVLNDNEWESITNKVTMVTFMQGMVIGNKVFNDYSVVSSDKNKQLVEEDEIYYFNKNSSGKTYYHRLDCPKLQKEAGESGVEIVGYKAIEYDEYKTKDNDGTLQYSYGEEIKNLLTNHNNITKLSACYDCLIGGNYNRQSVLSDSLNFSSKVAVAMERNRHYKVNAYLDSYDVQYKFGNISLTPSPMEPEWTRGNVIVTVESDLSNIKYYFEGETSRHDLAKLEDGSFEKINVTDSTTLYVYSEDTPSEIKSIQIANIDKTGPSINNVSLSAVYSTTADVNVDAIDNQSGIVRYVLHIDGRDDIVQSSGEFHIYNLLRDTSYTNCYVDVYDEAGNVSRSNNFTITTIR